jgi:chemosensory pili system protein ChpA (sensor histidine kinase/response regulator)
VEAEALPEPATLEALAPEPLSVEGVMPVETAIPEPVQAPSFDVELAQAFQYEANEILDASDAILQQLGAEPDNIGLLNDLRRGMHTLKGSSRMTGLMTVGDLAHAAESVLDALSKEAGSGNAHRAGHPATNPGSFEPDAGGSRQWVESGGGN